MMILAIEFSSHQRSVAVLSDRDAALHGAASRGDHAKATAAAALHGLFHRHEEVIETGGYGANALDMIEQALRQAQREREQVERLAVGLGPGSYTGIRGTIALAQGWQLAAGTPLLGISSAECIAVRAQEEGLTGRLSVVIDAQRNEFYCAGYEVSETAVNSINPLRLTPHDEVRSLQAAGQILIGPEVTKWFPQGRVVFPRASTLARLAASRTDFVPGEKLEPIYLREVSFVKASPPRHYS